MRPLAEINDLAGKRVYEWRRHEELAEITALIDEARSGGRAATSVATCLDHLHKGRVEKLYVCSDLDLSGYSDASGRLCLHPPSETEAVPDPARDPTRGADDRPGDRVGSDRDPDRGRVGAQAVAARGRRSPTSLEGRRGRSGLSRRTNRLSVKEDRAEAGA